MTEFYDPFNVSESPIGEPSCIIAGKLAAWRKEILLDPTLFEVSYQFESRDEAATSDIEIPGLYDEGYWQFSVLGSVSTTWVASEYSWSIVANRIADNESLELFSGYIRVFSNDSDRRTHAEIMLDKINSVLERRADSDVESYTIGSRSITKMSPTELNRWRDYYLDEVARTGGSTSDGVKRANRSKVQIGFK